MGAKARSFARKVTDLGGEKGVKKEMLGSLVQTIGNERRMEERRDKGRFFESD